MSQYDTNAFLEWDFTFDDGVQTRNEKDQCRPDSHQIALADTKKPDQNDPQSPKIAEQDPIFL